MNHAMTDVVWQGVYKGIVVQRDANLNVRVKVPQVLGNEITNWAPPMGYIPSSFSTSIGEAVAIMFMGGDINYPYYMILPKISRGVTAISSAGAVTANHS